MEKHKIEVGRESNISYLNGLITFQHDFLILSQENL